MVRLAIVKPPLCQQLSLPKLKQLLLRQLVPTLTALQQAQHQILELIASISANQAPISTPSVVVPIVAEPLKEATPVNVDNLSAAG